MKNTMSKNHDEENFDSDQENEDLEDLQDNDEDTSTDNENDGEEQETDEEGSSDSDDGEEGGDSGDSEDEEEDDSEGDSEEEGDKVTISKEELSQLKGDSAIYNRLKKQGRIKPSKKGSSKTEKVDSESSASNDLAERGFLASYGYKDKADQDEIRKLAKNFGLDLSDAIHDEQIISRVEHLQKKRKTKTATSVKTKVKTGTGGSKKTAQWYVDNGKMPDAKKQPKLFGQVQDLMASRSNERA
jgi:hypothetical protein